MSKIEFHGENLFLYNRSMSDEHFRDLESELRAILTLEGDEKVDALKTVQKKINQREASLQSTLFRSYDLTNIPEVWFHPAEEWETEKKITDLIGFRPEFVKDGFFMLFVNRIFTGDFIMDGKLHILTTLDFNREKLNDLCHEVAYGDELND
jgi:hypothetical protein